MAKHLGTLEQMLMFAVARLGERAHGLAVRREVERLTDRKLSPGAVYTTLDRLAGQGYVSSWIGEETPEGGGRRRKFYRVEPAGAKALLSAYEGLSSLAEGVVGELGKLEG